MSEPSSHAAVAGAPAAPRDRPLRSRHAGAWRAVAAGVLVVGVVASAFGGSLMTRSVRADARGALVERSDEVVHRISDERARVFGLTDSLAALVGLDTALTNGQLQTWFDEIDARTRWSAVPAFAFVARVPAAELAAFTAGVEADTPPALDTSLGFAPIPAGPRPFYCLTRFAVSLTPEFLPLAAGLDVCAGIEAFTDEVGDTGEAVLLEVPAPDTGEGPTAADRTARDLGGLYIVGKGVYEGGATPSTVEARREALVGFAVSVYDPNAIVAQIAEDEQVALAIHEDGGGVLSAGWDRASGDVVSVRDSVGSSSFVVEVAGLGGNADHAVEKGVLVAAVGTLVSVLLSALLLLITRGRDRALDLVEERTGELRHQALHDALTGLPNRALILDRAEHLMSRSRRYHETCATLFLDLDGFKEINDTVGHDAGDRLLCGVADRLRRLLRDGDTVGRMGGDEFVILLEGDAMILGPEVVAERILEVLREPFHLTDTDARFTITASIGIAVSGEGSAESLLRDADVALYQAKARGRDCFVVFRPEMHAAMQDRLTLGMELREALARDELFLEYQPTFDIETKEVRGVEALVRWRHPTRGVVPPLDFVPVAEDTGLIVELGRWVLREACSQMAAWHEVGHRLNLNVNVSVRQLDRPDFLEVVAAALQESGLAPTSLVLEITESALVVAPDIMAARLLELKQLGVRIAIDDFGTGYSSLSYLRQFPIDSIKIDRSFLTDLGTSPEAAALMHSLIQLGKNLGIETLAEGIEDDRQMTYLQTEQCDSGQGFLFARPLSVDAAGRFLAQRAVADEDVIA